VQYFVYAMLSDPIVDPAVIGQARDHMDRQSLNRASTGKIDDTVFSRNFGSL
jgi:hypothetical protein